MTKRPYAEINSAARTSHDQMSRYDVSEQKRCYYGGNFRFVIAKLSMRRAVRAVLHGARQTTVLAIEPHSGLQHWRVAMCWAVLRSGVYVTMTTFTSETWMSSTVYTMSCSR
ncbi:hypothetical protein J6590_004075 [Homalodisca vitripennis]|nr:hypothetical protein J6590_004075 [Homalodisca vitripennis]